MSWRLVVGDVLVVSAAIAMTLALLGLFRFRDAFVKIHAAAAAMIAGIVMLLLAGVASGSGSFLVRASLVAAFLLMTSPVGTHVLARLERQRREDEDGSAPH